MPFPMVQTAELFLFARVGDIEHGKQHSVIASHFLFGSFRASREVFLYYTISINSQGRFVHSSEKTNLIPKCVVPT
jgi:hypothetical protein